MNKELEKQLAIAGRILQPRRSLARGLHLLGLDELYPLIIKLTEEEDE